MVAVGAGSILLVLPHFLAGNYSVGGKLKNDLCNLAKNFELCDQSKDVLNKL